VIAARRPAGAALGALDGYYPDPAIGVVPVMGPGLWDEFIKPPAAATYGDLDWPLNNFAVTPTATNQLPTADTEFGILRVSTGVCGAGEGASIGYGAGANRTFYRSPPPGSIYVVKFKCVDTTQIEVASGFFEAHQRAGGAASTDFIGIRVTAGGNITGVVRNGTTESTVDFGTAIDTGWHVLGFRRLVGGTTQFLRYNRLDRALVEYEEVGDPVSTTNLPNTNLCMAPLNVVSLDGAAKAADIDFCGLGGRVER